MTLKLSLRERGAPIAVGLGEWQSYGLDDTVGNLAGAGIIRIERSSDAVLLFPSHYVGDMRAPNVHLSVSPKDEDFFRALQTLSWEFVSKQAQEYEGKPIGNPGDDLATPFVQSLSKSVEDGLPWQYQKHTEATSTPRGKPQFSSSIAKFISRGILHRLVVTRQTRRQLQAFGDVIWAAYRSLPRSPGASPSLISLAAMLMEAVEIQRDLSLADAIETGRSLLAQNGLPLESSRTLLSAALALLELQSSTGMASYPLPSGIALFVDLERVWEQAVASLVQASQLGAGSQVSVHGLAKSQVRLFGTQGPIINPDVVVRSMGSIWAIADAKYKVMTDGEQFGLAPDVYQLTCYTERTEAQIGLLVYVGTSDSFREIGTTHSGCRLYSVRISAGRLLSDRQLALANLGQTFRIA
ncbi:5-methylcytosine restriction system specificity protein McrC [Mesorhizobium atlanticum]|uniref:5-methylcytosine restriction system specificity protein McrC n=1 Tax=Mesorhizobium atlanticum TaxID=2233532 RepID=UPI0015ECD4D9|nr:hypothetical protein [Mesorhizobium atlanticum]